MRYMLFFLFCILGLKVSYAQYQPLVSEDKHWVYARFYDLDNPYPDEGYLIYMKGDTTINGMSYKKLLRSQLAGSHPCPLDERPCFVFDMPYQMTSGPIVLGYLREDLTEKKVYYIPVVYQTCSNGGGESLLFDFSPAVGDTLGACQIETLGGQPNFGLVSDRLIEPHYAVDRKVILTWGYQNAVGLLIEGPVKIYEGFGYDQGGILGEMTLVDFCEGSLEACGILSSVEHARHDDLSVHPNPFKDFLIVNVSKDIKQVELLTMNGQKVSSHPSGTTTIATKDLVAGMYVLRLTHKDGQAIYRTVMKVD